MVHVRLEGTKMDTFHNWDDDDPSNESNIPDKVVIYTMSIRNTTTRNKRTIYGHVTPNVIDQYWEAYAETLDEDQELVIERWNSDIPRKLDY